MAGEMYQREEGSIRAAQEVFPLSCTFLGFPPFFPASLGEHTVNTRCPKPLPLKSSILKCQEGGIQPHHLGGCSCAALPAGKGTPASGGSSGHRAGASPSSWGIPAPMKPFTSSRGSPPLFLAALCGTWAGAAVPDKEGARLCPAPGGEGQQKAAEPESPAHPSLPSELELHQAAHVSSQKKGDPAAAEPIASPEMSFWRAPNWPLLL